LVAVTAAALFAGIFGTDIAGALDTVDLADDPIIVAASEPEVYRSETSPAGNLTITSVDNNGGGSRLTVQNGEQIVLEVSDNAGNNCTGLTSAEYIGFAALPTVTVTAGPTVEIDASLRSSSPTTKVRSGTTNCSGFVPAISDQLVLTVTQAPVSGGTLTSIVISGISYKVGSLADTGDVMVKTAFNNDVDAAYDGTLPDVSNAYVTNLATTVGSAVAIQPGAGRTAPNVTLRETTPDASTPAGATGGICLVLENNVVQFVSASVAASGGDAVGAAQVLNGGTVLRFVVTDGAAPAESTFTVSNIKVNTQAGTFGRQFFSVQQCDPTTAGFSALPTVPAGEEPTGPTDPTADPSFYTNPDNDRILVVVVRTRRLAGLNRFETAQVIADVTFDCSDAVVIARADLFPDALAGNYVAGQLYAPILLVQTNFIPAPTLEALKSMGVVDTYVMGGTDAVSAAVATQLDNAVSYTCGGGAPRQTPEGASKTLTVTRISGSNRFGTARSAALFGGADQVGTLVPGDNTDFDLRTAILANGQNFPDALTGGPMAFAGCHWNWVSFCGNTNGFPLVLSNGASSTLPTETDSALVQQDIQQVIILGGTAAVPQSIEDLFAARGIRVIRLGGANRQATAVKIADFELNTLKWDNENPFGTQFDDIVSLARGDDFADALTMGPHAGAGEHALLLTESPTVLGTDTATRLGVFGAAGVFQIDIAGGTAAVSAAVEQAALAALGQI
jgi:putative cell wall-binding protein